MIVVFFPFVCVLVAWSCRRQQRRERLWLMVCLCLGVILPLRIQVPWLQSRRQICYPFRDQGLFAGLAFQQSVEQTMFKAGDGSQQAPAQRLTDFVLGKVSSKLPETSVLSLVCSLRLYMNYCPPIFQVDLRKAVQIFGRKMKGYYHRGCQCYWYGKSNEFPDPNSTGKRNPTCMNRRKDCSLAAKVLVMPAESFQQQWTGKM